MKPLNKTLLGVAMGACILAFSAATASAAIVCTGPICWHTHDRYDYPPTARVIVHEDDWRPDPGITFREHEGRGYWSGDRWTEW